MGRVKIREKWVSIWTVRKQSKMKNSKNFSIAFILGEESSLRGDEKTEESRNEREEAIAERLKIPEFSPKTSPPCSPDHGYSFSKGELIMNMPLSSCAEDACQSFL